MGAVGWVSVLLGVLTLWFLLVLLVPAWSRGRLAARDRRGLVGAVLDAWLVLLLVRVLLPPGPILSWVWVLAVVATAVGLAGAVLRWSELPWARPRRPASPGGPPRLGRTRWAIGRSMVYLAVAGVATLVLL